MTKQKWILDVESTFPSDCHEMKKTLGVSLLVLGLVGCTKPPCVSQPDQELRREIFKECMAALPAGPQVTKYNDWDEVVDSCGDVAYYQSLRGCGR